jgi:hypothetical protein
MSPSGADGMRERGIGQLFFGVEMRVERAMGEAGVSHHRNDRGAVEAFFPQASRCRVQDPIQRFLLAPSALGSRFSHVRHHISRMMYIMRAPLAYGDRGIKAALRAATDFVVTEVLSLLNA